MVRQLMFLLTFTMSINVTAANLPPRPASVPPEAILGVHIQGNVITSANMVELTITPGPVATRGVRIYSEPSHTRIATIVDQQWAATPEGKAWIKGLEAEQTHGSAKFFFVDLQEDVNTAVIMSALREDVAISTYINGDFAGVPVDAAISVARLDMTKDFQSSTYLSPDEIPSPETPVAPVGFYD